MTIWSLVAGKDLSKNERKTVTVTFLKRTFCSAHMVILKNHFHYQFNFIHKKFQLKLPQRNINPVGNSLKIIIFNLKEIFARISQCDVVD